MARRPEDRFQTAAEAAEALQTLADQEAGSLPAPRPTPQPVPDPSVPQPAASSDPSSAVGPSAPRGRRSPGPGAVDLVRLRQLRGRTTAVIALLIFLFELAVFGLGFALGHFSARPAG